MKASDPQLSVNSDSQLQMVSFLLGREVFVIDILQVQEIIRMMEITQIPDVPEYVEGMINLRGRVIPVIDLRKRFNFPVPEENPQVRIIVVKNHGNPVGLIVDSVSDVVRFTKEKVESPPNLVTNIDSRCISGVAKEDRRLLIILDVDRLTALFNEKTG